MWVQLTPALLCVTALLGSLADAAPSTPSTDPDMYLLTHRIPNDCDPTSTCDYFLGINMNEGDSSYLDIYLSGATTGWIAIGFSTTDNMLDADVLGCSVQSGTQMVKPVDTYNNDTSRFNALDSSGQVQTDIVEGIGQSMDGRITCTFSRLIVGIDPAPEDRNLDSDFYFLFGRGNVARPNDQLSSFPQHETTPPTLGQFNPVQDRGAIPMAGSAEPEKPQDNVATPSTNPAEYRLRRSDPAGCDPEVDCDYFLGVDTNSGNSSYLDIYLSGVTTGWIAIGFSTTNSMQDADVLGCSVQSGTQMVRPVDTYNFVGDLFNVLDSSGQDQTDIVANSGQFVNGRITCTFSRLIVGIDPAPDDRNLDSDYFFLFGRGNGARTSDQLSSFPKHENTPPTLGQFNPVQDSGEVAAAVRNNTDNVIEPVIGPADYRLRRSDPEDCDPEEDCDFFMGVSTNTGNSSYLDFYLVGEADGWVAVGFSPTANMLDADVLGCSVDTSGENPLVVDTYNPGSRTNNADDSSSQPVFQPDIVVHSASFTNGRITCVFSRFIPGVDPQPEQDRDLDGNYYFMFGLGDDGRGSASASAFSRHQSNPELSDRRLNPTSDSGDVGISRFRRQLIQAHGILMLIAWPLLTFTAIFFAAWMKPALPNGEWFQVHRAFNIAGLFVAVVAFILVFVAHKDEDPAGLITLGSDNKEGTAHFVLGIIIMALQIVNPIISIFRCKPNGKYRWIFNLLHGIIIGIGVELLAYANIGIGIGIFSERESEYADLTMLWVYLAFAIFSVVLTSVLFIVFTGEAVLSGGEEKAKLAPSAIKPLLTSSSTSTKPSEMELEQTAGDEPTKPSGPPPRKPPSRDAPLRWIALGVFLGVMIPFILALIILIAVKAN